VAGSRKPKRPVAGLGTVPRDGSVCGLGRLGKGVTGATGTGAPGIRGAGTGTSGTGASGTCTTGAGATGTGATGMEAAGTGAMGGETVPSRGAATTLRGAGIIGSAGKGVGTFFAAERIWFCRLAPKVPQRSDIGFSFGRGGTIPGLPLGGKTGLIGKGLVSGLHAGSGRGRVNGGLILGNGRRLERGSGVEPELSAIGTGTNVLATRISTTEVTAGGVSTVVMNEETTLAPTPKFPSGTTEPSPAWDGKANERPGGKRFDFPSVFHVPKGIGTGVSYGLRTKVFVDCETVTVCAVVFVLKTSSNILFGVDKLKGPRTAVNLGIVVESRTWSFSPNVSTPPVKGDILRPNVLVDTGSFTRVDNISRTRDVGVALVLGSAYPETFSHTSILLISQYTSTKSCGLFAT